MTVSERTAYLRLAIEVICDKWRIAVLHLLIGGALRTSQLQNQLKGVSPKVLTQTLRGLQRDGLIARRVYAGVPPRVEYQLTEIARPLIAALEGLSSWSEIYGQRTLLARNHYDMAAKSIVSRRTRPDLPVILSPSVKKNSTGARDMRR